MQKHARIAACLLGVAIATPSLAQDASPSPVLTWSVDYVADVIGPVSGGIAQRAVWLDNLSIGAALDLERILGWRGASLNAHVLHNSGGRPNDLAGTLEGVDNIEVDAQKAKLYEIYLDQRFASGRGLARIGYFDLNAEFYVTDAAGLFVGPAFGIGSELSATGPNGPSIFPSTALGVMGKYTPTDTTYVEAAILDAEAGVLGDPGGFQSGFEHGALVIGEVGTTRSGKLAVGAWAYTDKQDDIRLTNSAGDPLQRRTYGAYVLAEGLLSGQTGETRATTGFVRLGVSSGTTTDFAGGGQVGVHVDRVFASRPASALGLGFRYAAISSRAQANAADAGITPSSSESGVELTYADQVTPWLSVQPILQLNFRPGGDRDADTGVVAGLRVSVSFAND